MPAGGRRNIRHESHLVHEKANDQEPATGVSPGFGANASNTKTNCIRVMVELSNVTAVKDMPAKIDFSIPGEI